MPPKKETTKKPKAKKETKKKLGDERDFLDFITDACKENSRAGDLFLTEFNKPDETGADLEKYLKKMNYKNVSLEGCESLLHVLKSYGPEIDIHGVKKQY
jgi:hypothetical protein